MTQLRLLFTALGLAGLAGLNFYLTVFLSGLAIHFHWITLLPQFQSLDILANPAIIIISGLLFFLEFIADKIPWADSLWDSVHTAIRPIGGALLAIQTLNTSHPSLEVIIALLGGGIALTTHTAKAGTRLIANSSPEPFSNIGLSLAEDAIVVGGLTLIHFYPILSFIVLLLSLTAILWFLPRIARGIKAKLWLVWHKLNLPAGRDAEEDSANGELPTKLPSAIDTIFAKYNLLGEKIVWAVPCISTRSRLIPAHLFGWLIATREEPHKLYFIAKRRLGDFTETLDLDGYRASHEPQFLSEALMIYPVDKRPKYVFLFARGCGAFVQKIAESIVDRLVEAAPANPIPPAE